MYAPLGVMLVSQSILVTIVAKTASSGIWYSACKYNRKSLVSNQNCHTLSLCWLKTSANRIRTRTCNNQTKHFAIAAALHRRTKRKCSAYYESRRKKSFCDVLLVMFFFNKI